jgi:hypothetical protein
LNWRNVRADQRLRDRRAIAEFCFERDSVSTCNNGWLARKQPANRLLHPKLRVVGLSMACELCLRRGGVNPQQKPNRRWDETS